MRKKWLIFSAIGCFAGNSVSALKPRLHPTAGNWHLEKDVQLLFFFFLKKRRLQRSIYLCEQNLEKRGLRKWPYKRKKNASFIFVCSDSFAVFLLSFFRSISRVEIIHCMFPYLLSNLTVGGLSSLPATVRSSKGWKYKKECKNWPMETSSLACSRRSLVVFLCCPQLSEHLEQAKTSCNYSAYEKQKIFLDSSRNVRTFWTFRNGCLNMSVQCLNISKDHRQEPMGSCHRQLSETPWRSPGKIQRIFDLTS